MSILKRCSKVSRATFRIAPCDIDAKRAFLNSPNNVVRILAAPSAISSAITIYHNETLTSGNSSSSEDPHGRIFCDGHIETIHHVFKEEWHLDIEHFPTDQQRQSSHYANLGFGRVFGPYVFSQSQDDTPIGFSLRLFGLGGGYSVRVYGSVGFVRLKTQSGCVGCRL